MGGNVSPRGSNVGERAAGRSPALGVVVDETEAKELPRTIIAAREHGFATLVTDYDAKKVGVDVVRQLGGGIVRLGESSSDLQSRQRALVLAAREREHPGIVLHRRVAEPVDFEQSRSALRESEAYVADVRTRSANSTGRPDDVLVGIPAYNEEQSIEGVVDRAGAQASAVLVVDDGSEDETAVRATAAGASVVRHEHNRGYGAALKSIFKEASRRDVDHLVILDGDGQHDPTDIPRLLGCQRESGADVVIGSRFHGHAPDGLPRYRLAGLVTINFLSRFVLSISHSGVSVRDSQSGFRVYNREAIRTLAADESISDGMEASLDILFHAGNRGYVVEEEPTTVSYEVPKANTRSPLRHGVRLVNRTVQTVQRNRPLVMLGIPGLLGVLIGAGLAHWLVVATTPSLLSVEVAVLVSVLGVLMAVGGVVLHALNLHFDGRGGGST